MKEFLLFRSDRVRRFRRKHVGRFWRLTNNRPARRSRHLKLSSFGTSIT